MHLNIYKVSSNVYLSVQKTVYNIVFEAVKRGIILLVRSSKNSHFYCKYKVNVFMVVCEKFNLSIKLNRLSQKPISDLNECSFFTQGI